MILVALAIILVGFLLGLNHCAYRMDKAFSEKQTATSYQPEPVRSYAIK